MIALDTNILVYAHRSDSPWYEKAHKVVEKLFSDGSPWGIPWSCVHEFFAIVTHPGIYQPPTSSSKAIDQIDAWFESPSLRLLSESNSYWPTLKQLLTSSQIQGPQVHDARIAALCRDHGVKELWTADRDFGRFSGIKIKNPLVG